MREGKFVEDGFRVVRRDGIVCADCKHRKPDYVVDGKVILYGKDKAYCAKFPSAKPKRVLEGQDCPLYEKE